MGRRKIEIRAIKDDRNRSVTFLKRKGGLFKKAHELSVLCSVDVAVFVFGNNKKVYEYSSTDMRDLIARYQFHGGPNEHKGPGDYSGGNEDDDEEDVEGSPPQGHESLDASMLHPQYHGQQQHPFPQVRHTTPSASPPIPNGAVFPGHPHHQQSRGHTPQGGVTSRPASRNDGRRMGSGMVPQAPHPGITYMPTPPIYNPPPPSQQQQPGATQQQHGAQYPYQPPAAPQQAPQQQKQQAQPYVEERRPSAPPGYAIQPPPPPPPSQQVPTSRAETSPPQASHQQIPQISTIPPQPDRRDPQPPPPVVPKTEQQQGRPQPPQPPGLNTDTAIKRIGRNKGHSIFTPVEENRSILSQHQALFLSEPQGKGESAAAAAAANASRHQSMDTAASRTTSPPQNQNKSRTVSIAEASLAPPPRTNSIPPSAPLGGSRPRGPRLTVQIPDGDSDPGSANGESNSPRTSTETPSQGQHRHNSHSSIVLPPPSPSAASALLSAGATGPPNPFAKPPPQQNVNAETPASALPSRFLGTEFLPSPSSFYNDWNFRASDSNTLPSPLNFSTPVGPSGPNFLKDDPASTNAGGAGNTTTATAGGGSKRKTPDYADANEANGSGHDATSDAKRVKVDQN